METNVTAGPGRESQREQPVRPSSAMSVRVAALAGAIFFALILVHASLRSGQPTATDSGREVIAFVTRHQDRLQLGAVALGLAMPAALVWLSGLFRALRKAEGGTAAVAIIALGGGVLAAASGVLAALIEGTTATRIGDLDQPGARVWWTMFLLSTGTMLLGLLLVIGATAVVALQRQLFARWFAVTSVVLALASVVGAFTIGYGSDAIQIVAGLALLLDSVWIFVMSFFLWRDPELGAP